jgi:hypothetical protein
VNNDSYFWSRLKHQYSALLDILPSYSVLVCNAATRAGAECGAATRAGAVCGAATRAGQVDDNNFHCFEGTG